MLGARRGIEGSRDWGVEFREQGQYHIEQGSPECEEDEVQCGALEVGWGVEGSRD